MLQGRLSQQFLSSHRLWNFLPIENFPLTYNLSGFKSRINWQLLTVGSFLRDLQWLFSLTLGKSKLIKTVQCQFSYYGFYAEQISFKINQHKFIWKNVFVETSSNMGHSIFKQLQQKILQSNEKIALCPWRLKKRGLKMLILYTLLKNSKYFYFGFIILFTIEPTNFWKNIFEFAKNMIKPLLIWLTYLTW